MDRRKDKIAAEIKEMEWMDFENKAVGRRQLRPVSGSEM